MSHNVSLRLYPSIYPYIRPSILKRLIALLEGSSHLVNLYQQKLWKITVFTVKSHERSLYMAIFDSYVSYGHPLRSGGDHRRVPTLVARRNASHEASEVLAEKMN